MRTVLLAMLLLFLAAGNATALSVVYDESVDGDLSDDNLNPTFVTLFPEVSKVLASTTFEPLDRDFVTFTVPDGQVLDQIIWGLYESTGSQSFFAIAAGDQITSIDDASVLLGATPISVDDVATNILDDLGMAVLGGSGFSGPLGAGNYTLWFQDTSADTNYGYSIVLANAVPEPTMGVVPAFLGLAFLSRRRLGTSSEEKRERSQGQQTQRRRFGNSCAVRKYHVKSAAGDKARSDN